MFQKKVFSVHIKKSYFFSNQQQLYGQQPVVPVVGGIAAAPPILMQQPGGGGGQVLVQNISQYPPSPPIFIEIFKNSRFALGDNAMFEGRISGWPRPTLTWLRKNQPLPSSSKHALRYDDVSGKIYLQINKLGPGDEG